MAEAAGHGRSLSWFTVIGAIAAAVHYIVAVTLESGFSVAPAWANSIGFVLAFPVSYLGHSKLSFARHTASHQTALPRFLAIALTSFLGNQALLLSLLAWLAWPFWITLAFVMVIVAFLTYVLSRYWAFKAA
jgi:putative flippase GtrA